MAQTASQAAVYAKGLSYSGFKSRPSFSMTRYFKDRRLTGYSVAKAYTTLFFPLNRCTGDHGVQECGESRRSGERNS
jgi:hypothetical protein